MPTKKIAQEVPVMPARRSSAPVVVEHAADRVVVWLTGEFDLATAGDLRDGLYEAVQSPAPFVEVDLSACTFMDATALGVISAAAKRARWRGKLVLTHVPPVVHRLAAVLGMTEMLGLGHADAEPVAVVPKQYRPADLRPAARRATR